MAFEPAFETVDMLVVDPHPAARLALSRLLAERSPTMRVCGQADSLESAITTAQTLRPAVVLLGLQGSALAKATVALRRCVPGARIVVLADDPSSEEAAEAMVAGASAIVPKNDELDAILAAVERVAHGEVPSLPMATMIAAVHRARARVESSARLTARERDVMVLLREGLSTRQISDQLGLSPRTVSHHLGRIYRKLGARGAIEAIRRFEANGAGV